MTYEELLKKADSSGLIVKEKPLRGSKGRINGNKIAIKKDLTSIDKKCTLIEELGHYYTTFGNILDQSKIENRKQEFIARRWAVKKLLRVEQFIDAYKAGVSNRYELADFLGVTEEFVDMAIDHFKGIYGFYHIVGNCIIYFEPLTVLEKL